MVVRWMGRSAYVLYVTSMFTVVRPLYRLSFIFLCPLPLPTPPTSDGAPSAVRFVAATAMTLPLPVAAAGACAPACSEAVADA